MGGTEQAAPPAEPDRITRLGADRVTLPESLLGRGGPRICFGRCRLSLLSHAYGGRPSRPDGTRAAPLSQPLRNEGWVDVGNVSWRAGAPRA